MFLLIFIMQTKKRRPKAASKAVFLHIVHTAFSAVQLPDRGAVLLSRKQPNEVFAVREPREEVE